MSEETKLKCRVRFEKIEKGTFLNYELSPLIFCYVEDRLEVVINAKKISAINLNNKDGDFVLTVFTKGGKVNIQLVNMDYNESEQVLKDFTDIWQYIVQ